MMYDNNGRYDGYGRYDEQAGRLEGLGLYTARVYAWMFAGLLLTAAAAFLTTSSPALLSIIFGNFFSFIILVLMEFGLVMFISARIMHLRYGTAVALFLVYSALNGITLSAILLVYTYSSVAYTFGITAAAFGVMSVYGFVTRTDLTRFRNILFMGLIGLIVLSLVNMFVHASTLEWIVSLLGIFVFLGLTAYDTQNIRQYYYSTSGNYELARKVSIIGALRLYLDFINLFLSLLRLFGRRN